MEGLIQHWQNPVSITTKIDKTFFNKFKWMEVANQPGTFKI
jgi:hypothetical protein